MVTCTSLRCYVQPIPTYLSTRMSTYSLMPCCRVQSVPNMNSKYSRVCQVQIKYIPHQVWCSCPHQETIFVRDQPQPIKQCRSRTSSWRRTIISNMQHSKFSTMQLSPPSSSSRWRNNTYPTSIRYSRLSSRWSMIDSSSITWETN